MILYINFNMHVKRSNLKAISPWMWFKILGEKLNFAFENDEHVFMHKLKQT